MCKKIVIVIFILGYIFVIKYFFVQLLPFLLAFLCYFLLKPMIEKIEKKCHIHKNTIGMTLLISLYFIFIMILISIIFCIIIYVLRCIQDIPYVYQSLIEPFFTQTISWIEKQFPYLTQQDYLTFIYEYSGQILLYFMNFLSSLFRHVPTLFFSFFLFMIATFFLVLEFDTIKQQCLDCCSLKTISFLRYLKNNCLNSFIVYIKCQFVLMLMIFFILCFMFIVLKIKNPFFSALCISFLDSMPFIGVGIVLIPWIIILIIQKSYLKALYIFLIYLIINILRNFLEPHIMNKQMQIPSFILLLSMVIHLYLFGFIGVILSPIHMNILYGFLKYKG